MHHHRLDGRVAPQTPNLETRAPATDIWWLSLETWDLPPLLLLTSDGDHWRHGTCPLSCYWHLMVITGDMGPAPSPATDIWWLSLETLDLPPPATTDIWWSSLETCSNLFTWRLPPHKYWHLVEATETHTVGKRARYATYWNAVLFVYSTVRSFHSKIRQKWNVLYRNVDSLNIMVCLHSRHWSQQRSLHWKTLHCRNFVAGGNYWFSVRTHNHYTKEPPVSRRHRKSFHSWIHLILLIKLPQYKNRDNTNAFVQTLWRIRLRIVFSFIYFAIVCVNYKSINLIQSFNFSFSSSSSVGIGGTQGTQDCLKWPRSRPPRCRTPPVMWPVMHAVKPTLLWTDKQYLTPNFVCGRWILINRCRRDDIDTIINQNALGVLEATGLRYYMSHKCHHSDSTT